MDILKISLFGQLRIVSTQDLSEIQLTQSVQALLAYLLLRHGRTVSRDHLADLFWGELGEQRAHNCLNTALWRLRSTFRKNGTQPNRTEFLVTNSLGEVGFNNADSCWIDITEFVGLWERIPRRSCDLTPHDQRNLDRIIELYEGDLLERFDHEWVLPERERYRLMYLSSLARLMDDYHSKKLPEKSLEYAQRILAIDPLREDVHREAMKLYMELGQRTTAIHQYKVCYEILARELNITPMIETQTLYKQALCESEAYQMLQSRATTSPVHTSEEYRNILAHVKNAIAGFERAHNDLNQARQMLEGYYDLHKHLQ